MRAAAFGLTIALLAAVPAAAQMNRPPDRLRRVESPAAPLYREGMKLLADEYWADAAQLFERAIDADSQYALAFYGLGRARIGQKQYVAAVSALERCAGLYLQHAAIGTTQRMSLAQARQDQILELRDALRTIQSGPQTAARQGAAERIMDMIRDLERDMHDGMGDVMVRVPAFVSLSLGSAHFRRGSMTDAEREYRNALKANPRMGEAHNNLAVVLLLTGRPAEAEKSVKDAEKHGFRVPAAVKDDIKKAKAAQSS
jgi:tetratricopeptide (TPR) repeat protein